MIEINEGGVGGLRLPRFSVKENFYEVKSTESNYI